ncbi:ABC transporter substrate-binding protein [Bradyrhizobium tropiciagri]|uniref:ABC transporter substrate-binding protein n=1 Tax=Bradyrhizobium tropiciagri TaxID=312253 RepID=UPI001BAB13CB|nr:ABC transporter substrate-binding protein [Bradyrhizobium tropiciagri]MBR0898977.1 ABC transporter substrate-binding protein [Bradyrhizobium tropiciagri]
MYASFSRLAAWVTVIASLSADPAWAQKKYDPGASDTEIKIGHFAPYSGPASAFSVVGKVEAAYFKMINDHGGINGRQVRFVSYDDGYSPPKAVEQVRKLVESDEVLLVFNGLGTPSNSAIQKYMNAKRVPQLFVASGATKWGDPKTFPWTMGWQPPYQSEARIYAKYLLQERPDAKIAVFYQNDDFGRDYLKGLKDGLGDKASSMIVAESSYEVSEPTIDTHVVKLRDSGADVFANFASPKFAAQAIRKMAEVKWNPVHILNNTASSIGSVIKPAGPENAQGIISAAFTKDSSDEQWNSDEWMKMFYAFMDEYAPNVSRSEILAVYAYGVASTLVQTLQQCGDDLTRTNVMKQAASLKNYRNEALLPGVTINTGPDDFYPIEQLRLMRFKGDKWDLFGETISGEIGGNQ